MTDLRQPETEPGQERAGFAAPRWSRFADWVSVPTVLVAIVIVVALLASLGPASTDRIVIVGLINLVLVVALYIFTGNSGITSFGQLCFAAVGGYSAGLLVMPRSLKEQLVPDAPGIVHAVSLSPIPAVIVAGLIAAAVAMIVVVPLSRISGLAAGIATVSLLISARVVMSNWESVTRGQKSLSSIPIHTTLRSALAWSAVVIFCAWIYQSSSFGQRLRASKSDEVAAASIGVNTPLQRGGAFVVSAFFTGIGGAMFALFLGSMGPDIFYLDATFLVIAMLVVGGVDSLTGAVVGTLVVSVLAEILRRIEGGDLLGIADIPARPGIQRMILGTILVIILLRRPTGIVGPVEIDRLWKRRRAAPPPPSVSAPPVSTPGDSQ